MRSELKDLLKNEIAVMKKAADVLQSSFEKSGKKLSEKNEYNSDELENLEVITARFSRLSDILIQKILRLIDKIELEDEGSVRDRINRAEKKGAINSADSLIEIRVLRNQVSHEYLPDEVLSIFKKVLTLTPELLKESQRTEGYCANKVFKE